MSSETPGAASLAAWSADVYLRAHGPRERQGAVLGPLARGCITLLTGPRGVGKSWLALSLAHAAARGGALGPWRARKGHRVVFLDAAGAEAVLRARLRALGSPPPQLIVVPVDAQASPPDLALESDREALDRLVTDADLVVIDGLSALVRTGRGVGTRWAAVAAWLRGLRRRGVAVLLVDGAEPKALPLLADTVLRAEPPADGVREGDLRLQVRLLAARPHPAASQRFALTLTLRREGAVWRHVYDVDHRAIMAYRLDRADYSSRKIAKLLAVSPATAWRLVSRGERLPKHIRDGVDLDVPIPARPKQKSELAKLLLKTLLPREKGGAAAQQREDEGPAAPEVGEDRARGESPSPNPLPRKRAPEVTAAREPPPPQTPQPREAVKHLTRAQRLWRMPMEQLLRERGGV
jgi:putative DNA primase/helicase